MVVRYGGVYLLGRIASFESFKQNFFKVMNVIERLHLKFLKRILGTNSKATNIAVYGELGKFPLIVQIASLVAKFWIRIKNPLFSSSLVGIAAKYCIKTNQKGVTFANYILDMCDMKSLDELEVPFNELGNCGKGIKSDLSRRFSTYWIDQLNKGNDGGKLRTLCKVKRSFRFEKYLEKIINVNHRKAVTQLRISSHKLPVESGRYKNIPYIDRKCNLCDEVGDEFHYLMNCRLDKFVEVRHTFLQKLSSASIALNGLSIYDTFLYLMCMNDDSLCHIFAKYCFDVLTIYNSSFNDI